VQWRTFLGESSEPPITIDVPSRVSIGGSADGGH